MPASRADFVCFPGYSSSSGYPSLTCILPFHLARTAAPDMSVSPFMISSIWTTHLEKLRESGVVLVWAPNCLSAQICWTFWHVITEGMKGSMTITVICFGLKQPSLFHCLYFKNIQISKNQPLLKFILSKKLLKLVFWVLTTLPHSLSTGMSLPLLMRVPWKLQGSISLSLSLIGFLFHWNHMESIPSMTMWVSHP